MGTAAYQVTVSTAGAYNLWGRIYMSSGAALFYVSVDGGPEEPWNAGLATTYVWRPVTGQSGATRSLPLTPGTHTIVVRTGTSNAFLDRLFLTNDTLVVPQ
jgi:hypothetical protein